METCLLCRSENVAPRARAHGRTFLACADCSLVFIPPRLHPDRTTERQRYETHENDPADPRYRAFLRCLEAPLLERIVAPARGLDYGAGPGPTLSVMLEEKGFDVAIYDPLFAPRPGVLTRTYDFITCTETAEHFHAPRSEFDRLRDMLNPGGWLAVMTQWADGHDFERWSYARDVTHVCFYSKHTMTWIADRTGLRLEMPRRDVALFQRTIR